MPVVVTDPKMVARAAGGGEQLATPQAPPTATEQLSAAFQLDNTMVNALRLSTEPTFKPEPDFNPLEHLQPGEETIASRFVGARSESEMQDIRRKAQREEDWRQALAGGPINSLLADAIATVADPTTVLPMTGPLLIGKGATTAAKIGAVAASAAADVGITEGILHAMQETRSVRQSAVAVLMGGFIGAGVGGAATALSRGAGRAAYEAAVRDTTALADAVDPLPVAVPRPESAGAMSTATRGPEDTVIAGNRLTKAMIRGVATTLKPMRFLAPSLELSLSRFHIARDTVQRLVDTGLVSEGVARGLEAPVALETKIRRYEALTAATWQGLNRYYSDFRKAGGELSREQFFQEVGRAMRRGDTSSVAEVERAAKSLRANVFDPLKEEGVRLGLLPADVEPKTAASYFSRVYKQDLIKAQRPQFRDAIVGWLRQVQPAGGPTRALSDGELTDIADQIIDTIQGAPGGRVPFFNIPAERGPLKERTFNIPDDLIEPWLESNVFDVAHRYIRTMGSDIEFQKEFGRLDMKEIMSKLTDEKDAMLEKAKTPRERVKIQDEFKRQGDLLESMAAHMRGLNRAPYDANFATMRKLGRIARNLNFARLLGSVVVSSIPDVARIVSEEGLVRTFGGAIGDIGSGLRMIRLAKKEAQMAGTALDMVLNQRASAVFDLGERFADEVRGQGVGNVVDKVARGTDAVAAGFSRLSLLNHWNTAMKSTTAAMVSTRILETAEKVAKGSKLTDREARRLAQSGISLDMAGRIAKEADNWERVGGLIGANTSDWADRGAVDAFRNALVRDVDNTILTPGIGDAPVWTSTEWGKTIFQFKKFGSASTHRMLAAGMQNLLTFHDVSTFNGIILMFGLGLLSTAMRDVISSGQVRERTPGKWAADSIDRSGMLSMFYELDADVAKAGLPTPLTAVAGGGLSRFESRDAFGQWLGPTAGLASETGDAIHSALKDQFTTSDLHKIRKLFPAQNLFYFRYFLDKAEEAAGRSMNLPPKGGSSRLSSKKGASILEK